MASMHLNNFTHGHCLVTLGCKKCQYTEVKLSILTILCSHVILSNDFLRGGSKFYSPELNPILFRRFAYG